VYSTLAYASWNVSKKTVLLAAGRIVREYFLLQQVLPKVKEQLPVGTDKFAHVRYWNLDKFCPPTATPFRVAPKPDFSADGEKRDCRACKAESVFHLPHLNSKECDSSFVRSESVPGRTHLGQWKITLPASGTKELIRRSGVVASPVYPWKVRECLERNSLTNRVRAL
jgi:hypothetical protein